MSDSWGTLADPMRADGVVHELAAPGARPVEGLAAGAHAWTVQADPTLVRRYRRGATWCACLAIAIGFAGLIGWVANIDMFKSLSPGWVAMKFNTAIGLVVCGNALCLNIPHRERQPSMRWMSRLCAVFILLLGSFTLAEHLSDADLAIDQIVIVALPDISGIGHPGRMAPLTALIFIILAVSLLTMDQPRGRLRMLASAFALIATVISMVVLLGYIFGAAELYTLSGRFDAIAANTSIAFLLLSSGVLCADLPSGPLRSLTSPYLGGVMLRRMLPLIIVLMTTIVWARLVAQAFGLFDSIEFGAASVAVVTIISVTIILVWYAGILDRLDGARRRGERQIEQLNATLKRRVLALEAADREFQGFSYSMSHVLRAPLRAIHGYAQIVLDDFGEKLGSEGKRLLGAVQSSAADMSELLDGILAFLRLGWQPMTVVHVDMQQDVRTAIKRLQARTVGRKIRFEVGDLPGAQADAAMVHRIWLNLLDNAVKFTCARDEARIKVGARLDGDQMVYFVKDNGAGFDMEYVAKLFGIFQRLHDTTQFPGTGIGLAIVNRIVARHGGHVWAEGRPDAGATFYFSLPVLEKNHV